MKLKNVISCILLSICYSCIMDTKEAWFIKNRTKDTLLMTLSQVDTLPDWQLWNKDLWKIVQADRSSREETAFQIATIGNIALPDSFVYVNSDNFLYQDTCYLFTIEWRMAKRYSMNEIHSKRLYRRQDVTKKDFHHNMFVYTKVKSLQGH
ncbi:hypothetical protein HMPREF9431_02358 [Segatella oulorum F0390]|uniref:Uncharacterized protein n=2 Tax=Segatella oulorum TaxID=28136 RepID=G1WES1_9BACT|nr:hypothetical protein [Segatella oulorum]EGV28921.1 hypothetical protein HMPREF9431_02358 [Segatella oulorum F0390]